MTTRAGSHRVSPVLAVASLATAPISPATMAGDVYKRQGGRIRKILTGMESAFRYLMKTEYRKSGQETENNGKDVYKRQV